MAQTTVTTRMPVGFPGIIANLHSMADGDVHSKVSQEASASIPFGVMVQAGSNDDGVLLLTATSNRLVGVATHHNAYSDREADDNGVKPKMTLGVLNVGQVYVTVENAVTPASEVHVRAVVAGAEVKGAFRAGADGTDTIDISAFARFLTSAGAGEVALLDIDMRNAPLAAADV